MGRLKTITRRSFLIGSAAIAGGVAFGTWRYKTPYENPLLDALNDDEAALTPYVWITPEGIVLITPRADKGQGIYHAQAALIAEELDVDFDQIMVNPGKPDKAYWNTALAGEAVEFVAPGEGIIPAATLAMLDATMKFLGMQITGGSSSIPDGFDKLRAAGASARETLKQAAAQKTGLSVDQLTTKRGAVILPDGSALSYVSLASRAAQIPPVQDVPLRDPSQWRYIGKQMERIDIVAKSTGTQAYGIDADIEGMVYASLVLNPAQGGAMNSFDASAARAQRGIKAVVPITGGVGVVADNTWRAIEAAKLVEVDWGPADFPADMDDHWAALSRAIETDARDSRKRDDGDVEAVFAAAPARAGDTVVEAEYRAPYLAHAPLEPINAVVRVNTGDLAGTVDVWTGTQIPRNIQTNVAKITGVEAQDVNVHVAMMGGSFGHRLEDEVVKQAAEIAIQMKGVPVKLTYSREEDMTHDFPRQIAMARLRGVARDGRVESLDLDISAPPVVVSQMSRQGQSVPGPDSQIVAGAYEQPFAIPNHRVTGFRAPILAPISSWRSVGASHAGFFYNAALDEVIHAAGADPMEERLRLCADPLARNVLEAVAEMSSWDGVLGNGRGRGVAMTTSFGVPTAEVVEVSNTEDGIRIDKVYVAAEVGTIVDPVNFENLVAGGVIFGLGHAMNCEITYTDGVADQDNYYAFEGMRLPQCPQIVVRGLENGAQVKGIGEPPVPPAAPALAAAIFAATGVRLPEMPFSKFVDFA